MNDEILHFFGIAMFEATGEPLAVLNAISPHYSKALHIAARQSLHLKVELK